MPPRRPYVPRPYQDIMTAHILAHPRVGVFAGMGLGKTVATLTAVARLYEDRALARPTLVIAPLRVARTTWPDECAKWEHLSALRISAVVGTPADRRAALADNANVYTINYDNLPWLIEHHGGALPYDLVVADESTRLKGFRLRQGTSRARVLGRVAHSVPRWVNLTGTPAPNGLQDLWGQLWFIDKGKRLGASFTAFATRWFRQGFNGYGLFPLPHAEEEIKDRLRDVCLSLRSEDWFDLAAPIKNVIRVRLPSDARRAYRQMEREFFAELEDGTIEAANAAARSIKLLQVASGAAYLPDGAWCPVHDAKIDALKSVLEEAGGAPVLVVYHFISDRERISTAFPRALALDGHPGTIAAWNAGEIPLLLIHPQSAGHGLNLQDGGNIIVHFSHWWDLETHQQVNERIGPVRQAQAGHTRNVFEHYIVAADTMDEVVMARRETKREVQDLLLEALRRDHAA